MIVGKRAGNQNFWWFIHNMFGHPFSEIFYWLGMKNVSSLIHDETIPIHDTNCAGRG